MNTIHNISVQTNAGEDFYLLLGDFLNAFYRAADSEKPPMFTDAPDEMNQREYLPFLASTAHKLADDFRLQVPGWVFEKRCYLPDTKPYFACNATGNLRLWFIDNSPLAFKQRNLFVDENVLIRV